MLGAVGERPVEGDDGSAKFLCERKQPGVSPELRRWALLASMFSEPALHIGGFRDEGDASIREETVVGGPRFWHGQRPVVHGRRSGKQAQHAQLCKPGEPDDVGLIRILPRARPIAVDVVCQQNGKPDVDVREDQ